MEPITVVISGISLTGAIAVTYWKKAHSQTQAYPAPEKLPAAATTVPSQPRITYGFSTGRTQHPKEILLQALREAKSTLYIALHNLADLDIALEIIRAHRRGVEVRIITDSNQSQTDECQQRIVSELMFEGISVKRNILDSSLMLLKAAIIDEKMIATGSFNFTSAMANRHEDVVMRIEDSAMATDWHRHFDSMWNDRKRYALHLECVRKKFA